ncbi:MAG: transketolase [Chloroflexi bacterium]|nr:transketolase [Chloroflexota bacterium]
MNYRQSGHPGGSHSKVHLFLTLLLSGTMRWDIRNPGKRFGDRFILSAGHTIPLVYCTLALFNEAMRIAYRNTGDPRYALSDDPHRVLTWEDLLTFRHHDGLSGHAEMEGKTLFLKFNTGPSGHGSTAAVGEALALKRAGAEGVRVFALEGEGGLTPGANHEAMNTAWGLALDNLCFLLDWNDYGIDNHRISTVVYGSPKDWFSAHGWRVYGTEQGEDWGSLSDQFAHLCMDPNPEKQPTVIWSKNRKGRSYLKYDSASHGSPHPLNSDLFWQTKKPFMDKYNMVFEGYGLPAPTGQDELQQQFRKNLMAVMKVLEGDPGLVNYLANRLVELGDSVPEEIPSFQLGGADPLTDQRIFDYRNYPADLYAKPGEKLPNRAGLAKWGSWVNALGGKEYGRPLFIACSADLCESTNVHGFGMPYGDFPGFGWYERKGSAQGVLLPTEITEMANSGLMAGLASVNFSVEPEKTFAGFWGACSTYGSFSYLKYGMFRLFSQLAQDCQWKLGKVLWIAGHSGPETAEDSRTHFGIFSPGVTQLFPRGQIINLHPWEYNEVPVMLGAALSQPVPIIALHLTRPSIEIPDRQALGMASYFEAAKGAYIVRNYRPGQPRGGTLFVQGTSAMANILKTLPALDEKGLNVKIVCTTSPELFALQPKEYRDSVITPADRADSTVITTQARWLMHEWLFNKTAEEYAISADYDNRWRTGGSLEEVLEEAHLSPEWLLTGIERFVKDRPQRLAGLEAEYREAMGGEWASFH